MLNDDKKDAKKLSEHERSTGRNESKPDSTEKRSNDKFGNTDRSGGGISTEQEKDGK